MSKILEKLGIYDLFVLLLTGTNPDQKSCTSPDT